MPGHPVSTAIFIIIAAFIVLNTFWTNTNEAMIGLGITLELFIPEGAELFKRLVAVSDVVVESHASPVMRRLGLDYEVLRAVRPDLVMLSSTGYGHAGPQGPAPAPGGNPGHCFVARGEKTANP